MNKAVFKFPFEWTTVDAFSSTIKSRAYVARPSTIEDCQKLISFAKAEEHTICPKGSGYSYADMVLNDGHIICDLRRMDALLKWDPECGIMVVQPGCRLSSVLFMGLLNNWTLRACPGGMDITIGGALSNNVHGKDAWRIGNFGNQIVQFKLLTATGDILIVDREKNCELFYAAVGGMGLLGIIVEITLQLSKVETPFVEVTTQYSKNISETLKLLEKSRENSHFSIAWVDAFQKGKSIGRGFVTTAKWVDLPRQVSRHELKRALTKATKIFDILPAKQTWRMLRLCFVPKMIKFANAFNYYSKRCCGVHRSIQLFPIYNFMHNKIPGLETVYKPEGFYEFEPLLPRLGAEQHLLSLLKLGQQNKAESLLCAVKMHHKEDDYMLSYALDGFSIGIDIQRKNRNLKEIKTYASSIYTFTEDVGGKICLSKDELLTKESFNKMYGKYDPFIRLKKQYDEKQLFQSDMYRRLFL